MAGALVLAAVAVLAAAGVLVLQAWLAVSTQPLPVLDTNASAARAVEHRGRARACAHALRARPAGRGASRAGSGTDAGRAAIRGGQASCGDPANPAGDAPRVGAHRRRGSRFTMRCPKCHYLSFDPEPRCRNCGNGLALEDDDLFIREEEEGPAAPFADVSLRAADVEPSPPQPPVPVATATSARSVSSSPSVVDEPRPTIAEDFMPEERAAVDLPPSPARSRPAPTTELPLFVKGMAGGAAAGPARVIDEPLMLLSEEPRPPLAVRRKVQDRASAETRAPGPHAGVTHEGTARSGSAFGH